MELTNYPKTTLYLAIFALLIIVFILASLFTSFTEEDIDISSTSPILVGTPEFRTAVESVTNSTALPQDTGIILFTDGREFLTDLLKEIEGAENSITITNYIFQEGKMADETFDALTVAAERGVEVRLLLDAIGGHKANEEKLEALKDAGGKVEVFRPTTFRSLTRIHRRTHMRAIVIDGKIGYTGGLAFQDEWYGDGTSEKEWRDTMFKYDGRMARATQDLFNGLWRQTNGEILTGPKFYPPLNSPEVTEQNTYFVSLFHSPSPDLSADLLDLIWLSITGAKDHIYLSTPYLTPDKEITTALKKAVERGVRVEIMVPGTYTDTKLIQSASRAHYEELLEAGVHIYEYQPGRFHEKSLVVDGHWSLIGSANMDNRSATLNVENVFGIEDKRIAKLLEEEFAHNKENAQEILLEEFRPNLFKRVYYHTLRLLSKQF